MSRRNKIFSIDNNPTFIISGIVLMVFLTGWLLFKNLSLVEDQIASNIYVAANNQSNLKQILIELDEAESNALALQLSHDPQYKDKLKSNEDSVVKILKAINAEYTNRLTEKGILDSIEQLVVVKTKK
ncbi:MAG: hypothetical protein HYZ42_04955 [Bacteroidetes bacterium]|nr:hypothetical protein [Bacteroidota bacterium]